MNILFSTLSQGLIYAVLALGVYITFKILNFADMTVEGSLTLGGSVCAILITGSVNPFLSVFCAGLFGSLAGLFTGILHTKFKIQAILSGILTMIALYSINLRIMGKANVSLLGKSTIFTPLKLIDNSQIYTFVISIAICLVSFFSLYKFFKTNLGLTIRATGDNEQMMRSQGGNTDIKKILALMISNFMCAVSGALIVQNQGFSDVNMGTGTLVLALASIVIGESIMRKDNFLLNLIFVVIGSICYRFVILLILDIGVNPSDLKLFTSVIVIILLSLQTTFKLLTKTS